MSFAGKSTKGVTAQRHLWVFHGEPGTGKSTLASKFPKAIFADIEGGTKDLDVERFGPADIPNFSTLSKFIDWLQQPEQKYQTLVIDSATVLEAYMQRQVCGDKYNSIEELGFGKGYQQVRELAQDFMKQLRHLVDAKMDVIITAHSQKKNFSDPISNSQWVRYELQCNEKLSQIVISGSDNVFFLKQEVNTITDSVTKKTKASSDGNRLIMCQWHPAYDAKNRLSLPAQLPLDYEALQQAIKDGKASTPEEVINRIHQMISKSDEAVKKLAHAKIPEIKNDLQALLKLKGKIETMVSNV